MDCLLGQFLVSVFALPILFGVTTSLHLAVESQFCQSSVFFFSPGLFYQCGCYLLVFIGKGELRILQSPNCTQASIWHLDQELVVPNLGTETLQLGHKFGSVWHMQKLLSVYLLPSGFQYLQEWANRVCLSPENCLPLARSCQRAQLLPKGETI